MLGAAVKIRTVFTSYIAVMLLKMPDMEKPARQAV